MFKIFVLNGEEDREKIQLFWPLKESTQLAQLAVMNVTKTWIVMNVNIPMLWIHRIKFAYHVKVTQEYQIVLDAA